MAAIHDKISAIRFSTTTDESFDRLLQIGEEAAHAASGALTVVRQDAVIPGVAVSYKVKRLGAMTVLSFQLHFDHAAGTDGSNVVSLEVGDYLTSQATVLFIPIGPKDSAGYKPLRKFSEYTQNLLARSQVH